MGSTQHLTAIGTYSDGTTADITTQVTWASSATNVVTISSGLATGLTTGTANITANLYGVTSPAVTVTVKPTLSSIAIAATPPSESSLLLVGAFKQFTATGTYSNGSTGDLTHQVIWTSSDTDIVTISPTGEAVGVAVGSVDIIASLSGVTSPAVTLVVVNK